MILHIFPFVGIMRKKRPKFVQGWLKGNGRNRNQKGRCDKRAALNCLGSKLEGMIRVSEVMRNAQEGASKIRTKPIVLMDYMRFSETVRWQWTARHFLFKNTNGAYRWR